MSREISHAKKIQRMFNSISGTYDILNAVMTFGQDRSWRRKLIQMGTPKRREKMLDLGTGTGDIALTASCYHPELKIFAADFAVEMLRKGQAKVDSKTVNWLAADALMLPFKDRQFDIVTSGYLIRNVSSIQDAFQEMYRVLKPGGRVICLDTSPLPQTILFRFIQFYLDVGIPILGKFIAKNDRAYTYLKDSTQKFYPPEKLALLMRDSGFYHISYQQMMFKTQTLIMGRRPVTPEY